MIKYSFVVPAYNEQESVPLFYRQTVPLFEGLDGPFEIIFVNDGSTDGTQSVLYELCAADKRVKSVTLSRNFGQQSALLCGLTHASGRAVVTMDADLQDPPEVALQLIEKWKEGFEIVHARHKKRAKETLFKKLSAALYYRTLKNSTKLDLPLDCGDFKLLDRKAVDAVLSLREHARLLRAQTAWLGFRQTVVDFDRPERAAGRTKYTLKAMLRLAKGGIIPNSRALLNAPLIAGMALCVLSVLAFIVLGVLTALAVEYGGLTAWIFPALALATGIVSLQQGTQNLYIAEIYEECKDRPLFVVQKTCNFDCSDDRTGECESSDAKNDTDGSRNFNDEKDCAPADRAEKFFQTR